MSSQDASSASSKATPSGSVQNVPALGPARRQLAGEARLVAFVGEDPGAARERGARVAASAGAASRSVLIATLLLAGGDLLQLLLELGLGLGAVDALRVGRLDPLLHQRRGALAHVGDELGAGLDDL